MDIQFHQRTAAAYAAETPRAVRRKRFEFEEDSATGDSMRPQARKRRLRLVDAFHSITLLEEKTDDNAMTPSRKEVVGWNNTRDSMEEDDDDVWTETSTLGEDDEEEDVFLSDKEIVQKKTERKVLFELVFPEHYKTPIDRKIDQIIMQHASPATAQTLPSRDDDSHSGDDMSFDE